MVMVTERRPTSDRPVRLHLALRRVVHRVVHTVIWGAIAVAAVVAVAPVVLVALGYQPAVVHTDEARPTLQRGDVVVNEAVRPVEVHPGDLVTYPDPDQPGRALTATVVEVVEYGDVHAFTTTTAPGAAEEHWSIPSSSTVTRLVYRVPGVGHALTSAGGALTAGPIVPTLLVLAMAALLVRRSAARRPVGG